MSDSTHDKATKRIPLSTEITRMSWKDWGLSLVLHIIAAGLIVVSLKFGSSDDNPLQTPQNQTSSQASNILNDPDRVRDITRQIVEKQTERNAQKIAELIEIENKLRELNHERLKAYEKLSQETLFDKLKNITEEQRKTSEIQTELIEKIRTLKDKIDHLSASEIDGPKEIFLKEFSEIDKLQQLISKKQKSILENQNESLKFEETPSAKEISPQKSAIEYQEASNLAQKKEIELQKNSQNILKKWISDSNQHSQLNQKIITLKNDLDRANKEILSPQKQALDESIKQLEILNKSAEESQIRANQSNSQSDKEAMDAQLKNVETSRRSLEERQRSFATAQQSIKGKEDAIKNLESTLRSLQSQLQSNPLQTLSQKISELEISQKTAHDNQLASLEKQNIALSMLSSEGRHSPAANFPKAPPTSISLKGKNLAELYEEAKKAEQRIAEEYRMLRAAELAAIRKISLNEAVRAIQVAKLDYETLDPSLLSGIDADKKLDEFKTQAIKADQQINSMITLGQQMLSVAQGQKGLSEGNIQVGEWLKNQRKQSELMEKQSQGDAHMVGKDMTSLMSTRNPQSQSTTPESPNDPSNLLPGYTRAAPELPSMDFQKIRSYSSRKFSSKGTHYSSWFHIDSWYLIGPFPNRNRENLHTKFPPETMIDLDAIYSGKDGKPIAWKFVQWGQPKLRIPKDTEETPCVYYAYTELFFDEDTDLWIAMGSDDKGTVWINDILVWESWDMFKAWIPNEAYRKVHFTRGRNKILYRVENGQSVAMMSLMIFTKTP